MNHALTKNVRNRKEQDYKEAQDESFAVDEVNSIFTTIYRGFMQDPFKDWDGVFKDWTKIPMNKELKNNQIERNEVLNPCKKLCTKLLTEEIILKWRRLDAIDMFHEDGEPDLEIWIPFLSSIGDPYVLLLLAECKRPDGGVVSDNQKLYKEKYMPFANVTYEIITNVSQLESIIRKLSNVKTDMDDFINFQCEPTFKPGDDI